jgi:polyphosphate kinase 2 (PPK2 family)
MCRKNRLGEQSGGTSNATMSILTLSSPKETAARDSCISLLVQQIEPTSMNVANLHQPLKNVRQRFYPSSRRARPSFTSPPRLGFARVKPACAGLILDIDP